MEILFVISCFPYLYSVLTDSHNEWMSRIIHTSLDTLVQSESGWGRLVLEFLIDINSEALSHPVVMHRQVRNVTWEEVKCKNYILVFELSGSWF